MPSQIVIGDKSGCAKKLREAIRQWLTDSPRRHLLI
jgi:hypothetical protein